MKIYTKKGDKGETRLFNNECVAKDSLRVEAYGAVDELNAMLGFARTQRPSSDIEQVLNELQNSLFVLGSDLAMPRDAKTGRKIPRLAENDVKRLEKIIDKYDAKLPPLKQFILPGGGPSGASLQITRTVCRRAERITVKLSQKEDIGDIPVKFLNRLSDLLFVLARAVNLNQGIKDAVWTLKNKLL